MNNSNIEMNYRTFHDEEVKQTGDIEGGIQR